MRDMAGRFALVTGASAGLGMGFAEAYAKRGVNLAITARRLDRLESLADDLQSRFDIDVMVIKADLADRDAPAAILQKIINAGHKLDILVNNAGYGLPGTFLNTAWDDQADVLQVLLHAPVEIVHRVLPGMVERGYGRIINVASLVSFTPGAAGHTLYGPTKAALMRFSESINAELKGTGVKCTAVCPGLTRTEFHDANNTRPNLENVPKVMWQDIETVVETGIRANERNQPVIVTGGVNKALATVAQTVPGPIGRRLMSAQSKRFRNH